MKVGISFLEIILFFRSYKSSELNYITLLYAHRHIAVTMITVKAGNCSSTPSNTIIGSIVRRNCRPLCNLTMGSSLMIVFLWMWITRILVIWIQNLWQDVSNREYLQLYCNKSHLLCHLNIPHYVLFISNEKMGKLTVHFNIL